MTANKGSAPPLNEVNGEDYDGEWLRIGRFLSTTTTDALRTKEEASQLRKEAYIIFLQGGKILLHPKKRNDGPLRVVMREEDQLGLMSEFHESPWSGHRGTWATFEKLKERYWWPGMYNDVHHFVITCESC